MVNKIKDRAIRNKILIKNEKGSEKYKPIIFFFNNDEIIYIGKTDKVIFEYIHSKSNQINCTHYHIEFIDVNEINNIVAELILTITPKYNNKLPSNTKYISNNTAKKLYHINKREFKKHWNEHGRLRLGNSLFLEKNIFDNIFKIPEPYSENMPKVGTFVNKIEDFVNNPITFYDEQYAGKYETKYISYKDENGNFIEKIIHCNNDISEEEKKSLFINSYFNLKKRIQYAYKVTSVIDSNAFEAYSEYTKKKQIFHANENTWRRLPNSYFQNIVNQNYLESLN